MVSRAQLLIAVVLLAVAAGAAFLLLSPKAPGPANEVAMTGAQFAQEYNLYKVNPPQSGPFEGYYDFPSLAPGDLLLVRDRLSAIEYNNRTRATKVVLAGFEGAPALKDGLFFAGDLSKKFKAGDMVELRFHVVQSSITFKDEQSLVNTTIAAELLDELSGKARKDDGIPATAIRKYG